VKPSDRRRHPRITVDLPATVLAGGAERPARVKDLCRDAALVESAEPAALGEAVALAIVVSRAATVDLKGRVIRDAGHDGRQHAFAVLFSDLDPAAATEIEVLLQRLEREASPPESE
jgi:hypothetical protein